MTDAISGSASGTAQKRGGKTVCSLMGFSGLRLHGLFVECGLSIIASNEELGKPKSTIGLGLWARNFGVA
jgi:hypothetical protein